MFRHIPVRTHTHYQFFFSSIDKINTRTYLKTYQVKLYPYPTTWSNFVKVRSPAWYSESTPNSSRNFLSAGISNGSVSSRVFTSRRTSSHFGSWRMPQRLIQSKMLLMNGWTKIFHLRGSFGNSVIICTGTAMTLIAWGSINRRRFTSPPFWRVWVVAAGGERGKTHTWISCFTSYHSLATVECFLGADLQCVYLDWRPFASAFKRWLLRKGYTQCSKCIYNTGNGKGNCRDSCGTV